VTEKGLRVAEYLEHIARAIGRIVRYTKGMTEAQFCANEMAQDAVIRNIEVIGEAARNIARHHPDFAQRHQDVPWEDIYVMRNRVAHGYFSIDLEIVWRTMQRDLPALERDVLRLRHETGA